MAMPYEFTRELSDDQNLATPSIFEPPSYNISHGPDKALQWDPPADSDELAIALSYHFPFQKTLKRKMQAAVEKFLRESGRRQLKCAKTIRDQNPKSPKGAGSPPLTIPGLLSFNAETLEEVKIKRRKRAYEREERVVVGSNRGMACEVHRRQKLKCDPATCPRNGQIRRNRGRPWLGEHSNQALNDTGQLCQGSIITSNSLLRSKAVEEPLGASLPSSTNSSAGDIALSRSESTRQPASTEAVSVPEQISQFMGFQAGFSAPDDPFSFSLDPPFFVGHINDIDAQCSWKPDGFLLSIMRDSMYV